MMTTHVVTLENNSTPTFEQAQDLTAIPIAPTGIQDTFNSSTPPTTPWNFKYLR